MPAGPFAFTLGTIETCFWGFEGKARRLRRGNKRRKRLFIEFAKKVGLEVDYGLVATHQTLRRGPKHGGGAPQNRPKVPLGMGPHAFVTLKRPGTFCAIRAARQNVETQSRNPESLVV